MTIKYLFEYMIIYHRFGKTFSNLPFLDLMSFEIHFWFFLIINLAGNWITSAFWSILKQCRQITSIAQQWRVNPSIIRLSYNQTFYETRRFFLSENMIFLKQLKFSRFDIDNGNQHRSYLHRNWTFNNEDSISCICLIVHFVMFTEFTKIIPMPRLICMF